MKIGTPFVLLPLLIFSISSYSQLREFGKVSLEEMQMKTYPKDTTAGAVILFDKGYLTLKNDNMSTIFERHTRIKILNRAAFDKWGHVVLYTQKDNLTELKAAIYEQKDKSVRQQTVSRYDNFRTRYSKKIDQYNIVFPDLKEGSVIEYKYKVENSEYVIPDWYFQYSIPVIVSELTMTAPMSEIYCHVFGSQALSSNSTNSSGTKQYWQMTDVPAFKPEELMPDPSVYMSHLEFSSKSNSNWGWLALAYSNYTGFVGQDQALANLKDSVSQIIKGVSENREKIKRISSYIKKNVKWNGKYSIYPDLPNDVLKRKSGNAADINLLLKCFLYLADFQVSLVLLSTRDNGYAVADKYTYNQFNYVICSVQLSGGAMLLDATEKFLSYDVLPSRCLNYKGLMFMDWIPIKSGMGSKISMLANVEIGETGEISAELDVLKDGYASFESRKLLDEIGEYEYVKKMSAISRLNLTLKTIEDLHEVDKALVERYHLTTNEPAVISNDLMYVNPYIFLDEGVNPFILDHRQYPIDFESVINKSVVCNINIPKGYKVETLPDNLVMSIPNRAAECTVSVTQSENQVVVVIKLKINKTLFEPEECMSLKQFYDKLIAKKSEYIVLKKK
jgi:hypothetical protein